MALTPPKVVFFGSFQAFSAQILQGLLENDRIQVVGVVTTPPFNSLKSKILVKNPVQLLAETAKIEVQTPNQLNDISLQHLIQAVGKFDYFVTAGYGKLLPAAWLKAPPKGALNLHFSLLPKFRGANPAEWAILLDEAETGLTLIEMSPEFDTGRIIAQASLPMTEYETRETLYQKLYQLGTKVLPEMLLAYAAYQESGESNADPTTSSSISWHLPPMTQPTSPTPHAKRFTREDAVVDWTQLTTLLENRTPDLSLLVSGLLLQAIQFFPKVPAAIFLERAVRALLGFPTVWTVVPTTRGEKRMKLLKVSVSGSNQLQLDRVQIEGQQPATWNQVKNQVLMEK